MLQYKSTNLANPPGSNLCNSPPIVDLRSGEEESSVNERVPSPSHSLPPPRPPLWPTGNQFYPRMTHTSHTPSSSYQPTQQDHNQLLAVAAGISLANSTNFHALSQAMHHLYPSTLLPSLRSLYGHLYPSMSSAGASYAAAHAAAVAISSSPRAPFMDASMLQMALAGSSLPSAGASYAAAHAAAVAISSSPRAPFMDASMLQMALAGSSLPSAGASYAAAHATAVAISSSPRAPFMDASMLQMALAGSSLPPRYRYPLPLAAPSRFLAPYALPPIRERCLLDSDTGPVARSATASNWAPSPPSQLLPPSTRYNRAESCSASFPSTSRHQASPQPDYTSIFMLGTHIQLANDEMKRIEELSTEDFVRSASLSDGFKIDSSTVVEIEEKNDDFVILCFSVGEQKEQVFVETPVEHPFFVIGQGWFCCSPERARSRYGLQCQRLQVGDACVSLTHRPIDTPRYNPSIISSTLTIISKKRTQSGRKSLPPGEISKTSRRKRQRRWSTSY